MKEKVKRKVAGKTVFVSVCILIAVVVTGVCLIASLGGKGSQSADVTWSSLSSVRVDIGRLVTNRNFSVAADSNLVKADLTLQGPYFNGDEFVLPLKGRATYEKKAFDCRLELRAPVRFKVGEIYAGELRLGRFSAYDIDLAKAEKFVSASLFGELKDKVVISPLAVDKDFKAIHRINNDFIEFEK